jgi:hypothetical protein
MNKNIIVICHTWYPWKIINTEITNTEITNFSVVLKEITSYYYYS